MGTLLSSVSVMIQNTCRCQMSGGNLAIRLSGNWYENARWNEYWRNYPLFNMQVYVLSRNVTPSTDVCSSGSCTRSTASSPLQLVGSGPGRRPLPGGCTWDRHGLRYAGEWGLRLRPERCGSARWKGRGMRLILGHFSGRPFPAMSLLNFVHNLVHVDAV